MQVYILFSERVRTFCWRNQISFLLRKHSSKCFAGKNLCSGCETVHRYSVTWLRPALPNLSVRCERCVGVFAPVLSEETERKFSLIVFLICCVSTFIRSWNVTYERKLTWPSWNIWNVGFQANVKNMLTLNIKRSNRYWIWWMRNVGSWMRSKGENYSISVTSSVTTENRSSYGMERSKV